MRNYAKIQLNMKLNQWFYQFQNDHQYKLKGEVHHDNYLVFIKTEKQEKQISESWAISN